MMHADMALYRCKQTGRGGYRIFEREMNERRRARRTLEQDLRRAFAEDSFSIVFQPQLNVKTDRISGCEALMRLQIDGRAVSPSEFIPVAEEIGLINQIGEWILRQACAEAATWPAGMKVAVNMSPSQFKDPNLIRTVISALAHAGLSPDRLELEITEGTLLQNNDANLTTLFRLRELGVQVALDDFGTGFSSLNYLRQFPFTKIKIDRSFIDLPALHGGGAARRVRPVRRPGHPPLRPRGGRRSGTVAVRRLILRRVVAQARSKIAAMPWPPPTHMVSRP